MMMTHVFLLLLAWCASASAQTRITMFLGFNVWPSLQKQVSFNATTVFVQNNSMAIDRQPAQSVDASQFGYGLLVGRAPVNFTATFDGFQSSNMTGAVFAGFTFQSARAPAEHVAVEFLWHVVQVDYAVTFNVTACTTQSTSSGLLPKIGLVDLPGGGVYGLCDPANFPIAKACVVNPCT
jgi:hypothetical protein